MGKQVTIKSNLSRVFLPDGRAYDGGDVATLTDGEFDEMSTSLLARVVVGATVANPSRSGDEPVAAPTLRPGAVETPMTVSLIGQTVPHESNPSLPLIGSTAETDLWTVSGSQVLMKSTGLYRVRLRLEWGMAGGGGSPGTIRVILAHGTNDLLRAQTQAIPLPLHGSSEGRVINVLGAGWPLSIKAQAASTVSNSALVVPGTDEASVYLGITPLLM